MSASTERQNHLLQRLSSAEWERLRRRLQPVTLNFKEPLIDQGAPIEAVYFINSGVASVVTDLDNGITIETSTIGREGVVGTPAALGAHVSPWRVFAQVPGHAFRLSTEALREEMAREGDLRREILRYVNAAMSMLAQSAACNRAHSLEERLARWLLMTRDRVDSDEFPLTQEFLADMLGVRRPTVSLAGGMLQRAGLIRYSRGKITIVDRKALEEVSCGCYGVVRRQFEDADRGRPAKRARRTGSRRRLRR